MKSKFVLAVLLSLFILVPLAQNAYAESPDKMYYSAKLGGTYLNDATWKESDFPSIKLSYDLGYNVAAAFGYRVLDSVRIEGEFSYRHNKLDSGKISEFGSLPASGKIYSTSGMVNGYWDFLNASDFTPYLGLGVGWSSVKLKASDDSDSSSGLAGQIIGGVSYDINQTVALTLDYRFFTTKDPKIWGAKGSYRANDLAAGIRVSW